MARVMLNDQLGNRGRQPAIGSRARLTLTILIKRRDAALQVMRDHDVSQRRACRLVGVDLITVRRERPTDCTDIRKEVQEIAARRRRFGYPTTRQGITK